jgi:dihydroxyacetone kinase
MTGEATVGGGSVMPLDEQAVRRLITAMAATIAEHAEELTAFGEKALAAVKARGKSDVGAKTMLDVLAPDA